MPPKRHQPTRPRWSADAYQYYIPSTKSTHDMVRKKKPGEVLWPNSYTNPRVVRTVRRRKTTRTVPATRRRKPTPS